MIKNALIKVAAWSSSKADRPIGVFDSGLGGLTVVQAIRKLLPNESIVYFGDIARLPYGIKSRDQILRYSIQNTLFLIRKKVKAVVIACNSSSSASYAFLKKNFNLPVVDVIEPAVEAAAGTPGIHRIGVIATRSTVLSSTYEKKLRKMRTKAKIVQVACPLFVPLVEEGWTSGKITRSIIDHYLSGLKKQKADAMILGCTHYPLLKKAIAEYFGKQVKLIDSAAPTAKKLANILKERGLLVKSKRRGQLKVFVSDLPGNFIKLGERFLGEKLSRVEIVRLK